MRHSETVKERLKIEEKERKKSQRALVKILEMIEAMPEEQQAYVVGEIEKAYLSTGE